MKVFILLILLISSVQADVRSTNGSINFDTQSNGTTEMQLNSTGLGIGISPAANLHINGNALISGQVTIGNSTSSNSNLHISGTIGFSSQTITGSSNVVLDGSSSMVFINASDNITLTLPYAGNILGKVLKFKSLNSNTTPILVADSCNIDESVTLRLKTSSSGSLPFVELIASSGNWLILSSHASICHGPFLDHNLKLWFNASDIDGDGVEEGLNEAYVDGSGNITQWNDLSGTETHLDNNPATTLPSYTTFSNFNNKYAVDFFEAVLRSTQTIEIGDENTTFTVVNFNDTSSRDYAWNSQQDTFYLGVKADDDLVFIHNGTDVDYPNLNQTDIITTRSSASSTSYQFYSSGNQILNSATSPNAIDGVTTNTFMVGARTTGIPPQLSLDGQIAEIIIYDSVLTDAERRRVEAYLANKYNLDIMAD